MKKILIVDNDTVFLKFMEWLLTKHNHQVVTATDGLQAIDLLNNYTPDVMYIDLLLPDIDGETLCKLIRGMDKLKKVWLAILHDIFAEEWIDFPKLGANAHIAKGPFIEMAQKVLSVLDQPELTYA